MTNEWDRLDTQLVGVESKVADFSLPARVTSMAPHVARLRNEFDKERAAKADIELERLRNAISRVWSEIEPESKTLLQRFSFGGIVGLIVLLVSFLGIGTLLWTYISQSGLEALRTIEGTRPLLTVAAIVATLAFGGGLVFAALFADDANFETRFRMAREIFLVFSGVFATVVGFHFGAATSGVATQMAISKIEEKDGKLAIDLKSGTPPFKVEITADGSTRTFDVAAAPINVEHGFDLTKSIAKLTVKVRDKTGEDVKDAVNVTFKGFVWPQKTGTQHCIPKFLWPRQRHPLMRNLRKLPVHLISRTPRRSTERIAKASGRSQNQVQQGG